MTTQTAAPAAAGSGKSSAAPSQRVAIDWRAALWRWWAYASCALLLVLFGVLSYSAVLGKSATYDEPLHVVGGFMHVNFNDYRINPEDPALFGIWSALPHSNVALSIDITSVAFRQAAALVDKQWKFVVDTLYATPENDPNQFLSTSRAMFTFIGIAAGAIMAWWTWRLAGAVAAVVATFCFALDPNFLAHASLVKNDVALTLFMLCAAFAMWGFGRHGSWWKLLVLGLVCGGAINVKFSGILLGFTMGLMLLARALLPVPWRVLGLNLQTIGQRLWAPPVVTVLVMLVSWAVTWGVYGFRFAPTRDGTLLNTTVFLDIARYRELVAEITQREGKSRAPTQEEFDSHHVGSIPVLVTWMEQRHLMPQAWLFGFLYTYATTQTRSAFLMGNQRLIGWWYYFPMAMLFKTPLAMLLAMIAAGLFSLARLIFPAVARWELDQRATDTPTVDRLTTASAGGVGILTNAETGAPNETQANLTEPEYLSSDLPQPLWAMLCLLLPPAVYGFAALTTNLNLGIRHVLPIYPFIYMGIGLLVVRLLRLRWQLTRWVIGVLAVALAAETLLAWPNYLAFFNVACGRSRGGIKLLADSNLDWGQDLPAIVEFARKHTDKPLYLSYFGMAQPEYYGVKYTNVTGGSIFRPQQHLWELPPQPGYLVVSATNVQMVYLDDSEFKALRGIAPRQVLNGTIYVYDWPLATGPVQPPPPKTK